MYSTPSTLSTTSSTLLSDKALDKYERILEKYDWRASNPPRGYQAGIGRGAKLIVTTAELRVGVGVEEGRDHRGGTQAHGTAEEEVFPLLDTLEALEEQRQRSTRRRQRARTEEAAAASPALPRGSVEETDTEGGRRHWKRETQRDGEGNARNGPLSRASPEASSTSSQRPSSRTVLSATDVESVLLTTASSTLSVHNPTSQLTTRDAREEAGEAAEGHLFEDERGITMRDVVRARQHAAEKNLADLLGMGSPEEQTTWITHSRAYRESGQRRKALATLVEGCRRTGHKGMAIWQERLSYYPLVRLPISSSRTNDHPHTTKKKSSAPIHAAGTSLEAVLTCLRFPRKAPHHRPSPNDHDEDEEEGVCVTPRIESEEENEEEEEIDKVSNTARRKVLEEAVTACPSASTLWTMLLEVVFPHERLERTQRAILACPTAEPLWWKLLSLTPTMEDQKKLLLRALQRSPQLPSLWGRLARLEGSEKGRKIFHAAGQRYPSLALAVEAAKFSEWEGLQLVCFSSVTGVAPPPLSWISTPALTSLDAALTLLFSSSRPSPVGVGGGGSRAAPAAAGLFSSSFWPWGTAAGAAIRQTMHHIQRLVLSAGQVYFQPQHLPSREAWLAMAVQVAMEPRDSLGMPGSGKGEAENGGGRGSGEEGVGTVASPSLARHGAETFWPRLLAAHWKKKKRREVETYGWTASSMLAYYVWPEWKEWSHLALSWSSSASLGRQEETEARTAAHTNEWRGGGGGPTPSKGKKERLLPLFHRLHALLYPSSSSSESWMQAIVSMLPSSMFAARPRRPTTTTTTTGDSSNRGGGGLLFLDPTTTPFRTGEPQEADGFDAWRLLPLTLLSSLFGCWWMLMEQYHLLLQQLQRIEAEDDSRSGVGPLPSTTHSLSETPSLVVLLLEEMCRRAGPPSCAAASPSVWGITPLLMAWHQEIHQESHRLKVEAKDEENEKGKGEWRAHDHAPPSAFSHRMAEVERPPPLCPGGPTPFSTSVPTLFHLSLQEATHTVEFPFRAPPTPQDGVGLSTSVLSITQLESFLLLFLLDAHTRGAQARHASWPSLAGSGRGPETTKKEAAKEEKAVSHETGGTPTQGVSSASSQEKEEGPVSSVWWMTPLVLRTIASVWMEEGRGRPPCPDPHTAAQLVLHAGVVAHCTPYLSWASSLSGQEKAALLSSSSSSSPPIEQGEEESRRTDGRQRAEMPVRLSTGYDATVRYVLGLAELVSMREVQGDTKERRVPSTCSSCSTCLSPTTAAEILSVATALPPPPPPLSALAASARSSAWEKRVVHLRATVGRWTFHRRPSSLTRPRGPLWVSHDAKEEDAARASHATVGSEPIPESPMRRTKEEEEEEERAKQTLRQLFQAALQACPRCVPLWCMWVETECHWAEQCLHAFPYTASSSRFCTAMTQDAGHRGQMATPSLLPPPPSIPEERLGVPAVVTHTQHHMRHLCTAALDTSHARAHVQVWVCCAVHVESALFGNAGAARALLSQAAQVCAGGTLEQMVATRRQRQAMGATRGRGKSSRGGGGGGEGWPPSASATASSVGCSREECTHILLAWAKAEVERRHSGPAAAREVIDALLQALPKVHGGAGALRLPDPAAVWALSASSSLPRPTTPSPLSAWNGSLAGGRSLDDPQRVATWVDLAAAARDALGALLAMYVDLTPLSSRPKAAFHTLSYWPAPHPPLLLLAVAKVYHHAGLATRPPDTMSTEGGGEDSSPRRGGVALDATTTPSPTSPPLCIKAVQQLFQALENSHGRCGDAIALLWEWCSHPAYDSIVRGLLQEVAPFRRTTATLPDERNRRRATHAGAIASVEWMEGKGEEEGHHEAEKERLVGHHSGVVPLPSHPHAISGESEAFFPSPTSTVSEAAIRWLVCGISAYFQRADAFPSRPPFSKRRPPVVVPVSGETEAVVVKREPEGEEEEEEEEARSNPSFSTVDRNVTSTMRPSSPGDGPENEKGSAERGNDGNPVLSSSSHTKRETKKKASFVEDDFRLPQAPNSGPLWDRVAKQEDPSNVTLYGYRDSIEEMLRKVRQLQREKLPRDG